MAYVLFDPTTPDATAQTLTQMGQSERNNLKAVRDACVMGGGFYGFNLAVSGGTAGQPALLTYSRGTEQIKAALTWGTTGGEAGSVTVAVYSYSADSGSTWATIGTKTITYDTNANVTATTWA
jgi:phenylacetate-coenzyme A ligase PaaK-like adenylate-forming protein